MMGGNFMDSNEMSDRFVNAINNLKNNEKSLIEIVIALAKYNALYYTELVGRGFGEEAALELTKAHGLKLTPESK